MKTLSGFLASVILVVVGLSCAEFDNSPEGRALKKLHETPDKQQARAGILIDFKEKKSSRNALILDISLENKSNFKVKDFQVECVLHGESNTEIQRKVETIFQMLEPKDKKTFKDINFGLVHSQTKKYGCQILDFSIEN